MVCVIWQRHCEAKPSNPEGITCTTVENLPSQAEKGSYERSTQYTRVTPFRIRRLKEQRLKKCGLCFIPHTFREM